MISSLVCTSPVLSGPASIRLASPAVAASSRLRPSPTVARTDRDLEPDPLLLLNLVLPIRDIRQALSSAANAADRRILRANYASISLLSPIRPINRQICVSARKHRCNYTGRSNLVEPDWSDADVMPSRLLPRRIAASTSACAAHSRHRLRVSSPSRPQISLSTISTSTPKTSDSACASRSNSRGGKRALQRRDRVLAAGRRVAARELRLAAQRAGLALRPLVERQLQRRLERRLERLDARHRRVEQFGDAALGIGGRRTPVRIGPSASSTTACTSAAWLGK